MLNGSLASDVLVVALAEGAKLQQPLHVLHVSTAAAESSSGSGPVLAASTARLLISLGPNASCELVEEYVSDAAGHHVSMPVAEVQLGAGSELKHGYVEREAAGAQHYKATLVTQVGGWAGPVWRLCRPGCMASLTHDVSWHITEGLCFRVKSQYAASSDTARELQGASASLWEVSRRYA